MSSLLRGKRVLLIVENNAVPFDRRVWQEAKALRDAGCRVTVISPRSRRAPRFNRVIDEIRVLRHPRIIEASRSWQYVIEYANALFWEVVLSLYVVTTGGVDVVHIANPPDTAFILGPLLRLTGAKVLFDQHDLSPEIYEAKFHSQGFLWRALLTLERWSYRIADVVITSNGSMRRHAIGRGGKEPERVFVVRNGPDLERFHPNGHYAEGDHKKRVCYLGIIGEQEGLDSFLRVIADIVHHRKRTDASFVVIGDGTGLPALQAQAARSGLADEIHFTGYLSGEDLVEALDRADVCVVPEPANSLNEQSTLVKTMEYMAMAKPVVQYDLTEARVTSADTALYAAKHDEADLADKIVHLLDNPETGQELGRRAARRVREELAWRHQIPSLMAAYESTLKGDGDA